MHFLQGRDPSSIPGTTKPLYRTITPIFQKKKKKKTAGVSTDIHLTKELCFIIYRKRKKILEQDGEAHRKSNPLLMSWDRETSTKKFLKES